MSTTIGTETSLSLGRRVICDLMHVSLNAPLIAFQKDMNIEKVLAAREDAQPRPSWCSIFTKAYAKVVAARPELRRAFLSFPTERLFEYSTTSADIAVESCLEGENVVIFAPVKEPETCSLLDIDRWLHWCKEKPLERLLRMRRAFKVARYPRWVRRWVWWYVANASAYQRARYVGAFAVSSVANWGADSLTPISPCTTLLHYGAVDPQGNVSIRLTFDHRVMDGSVPSKALAELEQVLKTDIVTELQALRMPSAAWRSRLTPISEEAAYLEARGPRLRLG